MAPWRLARSLATLRAQINALSPNRSVVSDGTIGDAAHSARTSDHNPDGGGVVRALDLTHDLGHGIDSDRLARALIAARDPRIKYVISRGQIASGVAGPKPWTWRRYTGRNPHNAHVHLSVVAGKAGDDPRPWDLSGFSVAPAKAGRPETRPKTPLLVAGNKGADVKRLQSLLNAAGAKLVEDGDFGARTEAAVRAFQRRRKLVIDGKAGPQTWAALAD